MMHQLGLFIVKRRWWVVATWVIAAILIVGFSPALSSIESNDQSAFLPSNYESVKADNIAKQFSKHSDAPTDIIVFKNTAGTKLTTAQKQTITQVVHEVNNQHLAHVISVTTNSQQLAPNHTAQLGDVTYSGNAQDTASIDAVKDVRSALAQRTSGTDISAGLTGGQAIAYDTQDSANRAIEIVSIGTLLLVLFLPAFIFRSPLAGLFPLIAVGIVYTIAGSLIADAGHMFGFHLSQQLSILFTVVLFGIGTDYILFLLFRYRERLRTGDHTRGAVAFALSRAGLAILSAALVVLSSFSALFFAKFGIFSSLAPGLVICVAVMMLAALTLVPALLAIIGEKVFWPSKAWMVKAEKPTLSKKIGGLIERRPGRVSSGVILVLLVLTACAFGFKADFSSFSQPPKGTPSAAVYNELTASFPAGTLSPTQVYVTSSQPLSKQGLTPLKQQLSDVAGVSAVLPPVLSSSARTAEITVFLKAAPFDASALSTVGGPVRTAAHSFDSATRQVYVGGATSAIDDVQSVTDRDLRVIFPIAAAFIFIILALLLRSLIAPLLLLLCVSLGYVATLGATTLIFEDIGGVSGLISFIPLFMYIFVVAIGTDYNILTVTRLREEIHEGHGPRRAAHLTVEHSSATVAAAGLILASTFGSLTLGGISFLTQMGAAIAIGVSLAAFVIAPFLIPSLSALLGYHLWWPSRRPDKI
jgi:RND superfamily putative drug exporter